MLYTDNIGLKKPAYSDPADIADINENSDIIDREFGNRYLKSETYSVEQANNAIAQAIEALPNGLVYRGAVNYYKDLPTANNELGDTYSVKYQGETGTTADGNEYAWGEYDGTLQWIKLGVNAYTKNEIDEQREAIESDILNTEKAIEINRLTLGTQITKNILKLGTINPTNGLTVTVNADKSLNVNGTVDSFKAVTLMKGLKLSLGKRYTMSISDINTNITLTIGDVNREETWTPTNTQLSFMPKVETNNVWIQGTPGTVIDNVTLYPMIRSADTDSTYEPHVSPLQEQINEIIERIQALETSAGITTASE